MVTESEVESEVESKVETEWLNAPMMTWIGDIWARLATVHPELPVSPRLAVGSLARLRERNLAHWLKSGGGELYLSARLVYCSPEKIIGVIAHEAAHALGSVRGVATTSNRGYYHNRAFMRLAAETGLMPDPSLLTEEEQRVENERGWATLNPGAVLLYKDLVERCPVTEVRS